MKKINIYIILIITVFSSYVSGAQTISKVDLILKEVSNELNKLLPSQINENSKVLSVVAIGNKTLLYSIEMTINPSLIEITNQTDKIKNSFRTNPVYSLLRENKINIIYNYKNPKGEFLFDIKFNCGDLDSSNKNQIKLDTRSIEKDFKNGIMPNLFGMNLMDAVFLLENMGLDVSFEGFGHITNQSIKKGNKISNYKEIKLLASL